jgi:hypothetical protein
MTLTANSRLLLGTTTEGSELLQVNGSGKFSGQLTASSTAGGTSAIFQNTGVQNSNGIELRGGTAGTAVNWKIEKDNTIGNAFQLTPSTTNGGTTYTTPVLTIASTGAATFSSSVSLGGGSEGLRIGNVGDNSAYDNVKIYYTGYSSGAPRVYLTPRTTPGSGVVNTFFHLQNSNGASTTSNNTMGLLVDGNVGIGTTSPAARLSVNLDNFPSDGGIIARFTGGTTTPTTERFVEIFQSYTGAAFDSPMLVFRSNTNASNNSSYGIVRGTADGAIVFSNVNNTSAGVSAASERMRITSGGNLLVGSSVDSGEKLQVAGSAKVTGNVNAGGLYNANGVIVAAGSSTTTFYTLPNTSNNTVWLISVRQQGAASNVIMGMAFAINSSSSLTRIAFSSSLSMDFTVSGLALQLVLGAGFTTTTWEYTITQIK